MSEDVLDMQYGLPASSACLSCKYDPWRWLHAGVVGTCSTNVNPGKAVSVEMIL